MGFQNVIDATSSNGVSINGISLAITGMAIVFVVLVLVSLFIAYLPRLLPIVEGVLPPAEHHHGAPMPSPTPVAAGSDDEIIAAIGFALHRRQSEG
jgi:oxaloacetate decarboxylase gamma subunit